MKACLGLVAGLLLSQQALSRHVHVGVPASFANVSQAKIVGGELVGSCSCTISTKIYAKKI